MPWRLGSTRRLYNIGRDVIFEEDLGWDWTSTLVQNQPDHFIVEYPVTVHGPATAPEAGNSEPGSPAAASSVHDQPVASPGNSNASATPVTPPADIQWATPPQGQSADSEGVPLRFRTLNDLYDNTEELENLQYSGLCLLAADEPASVDEALGEKVWKKAMETELQSIKDSETWHLSDLPRGHKAIGLKWVFKVKRDDAGEVVKHKARLVAKGYAQKQGVDYDEVFAPVARIETVRILFALAAQGDWEVHHMDVKSAFLNGDLQEEVYVHLPPGFTEAAQAGKVLGLKKALYGLKQAPRAWNAKLDQELNALGFHRSTVEHAVYKRGTGSSLLLVGVYVDDLIICGPDKQKIAEFKEQMKKIFSMSDLGLLSYYLGMEVKQDKDHITVCQRAYAAKIVETCRMTGCNPVDTHTEQRVRLSNAKPGSELEVTRYRIVIGSLRYLVNTRPDIAYAVGIASRFMEAPAKEHWAVVKRIVRYISGTLDYGCRYLKNGRPDLSLLGFTDSDCSGDLIRERAPRG